MITSIKLTSIKLRFYGYLKDDRRDVKKVRSRQGGEEVVAVAYDTVIPGFNTFNRKTLRPRKSFPSNEFNFGQL